MRNEGLRAVGKELRILMLEDVATDAELVEHELHKGGVSFSSKRVETEEAFLKELKDFAPNLILSDYKLSSFDGVSALEIAKEQYADVPFIFVSGAIGEELTIETLKGGATDYVLKDRLSRLVPAVSRALREVEVQTERKQAIERLKEYAEELEKANQELKRIDEIKSEFVSVSSHELRTPLAAIKNAVQLILKGKTGEVNEKQEGFLLMAERNINRLTNIINDLLDVSRIESGKIEMNFEEVDLRGPTEFIVSSLTPQADGKSIQLRMQIPAELPSVYGDQEKIEQILTNLIGNAIKFTPEGGEITVSAKPLHGVKNMVAISVRDSGIGIPEDQLGGIFKKFHQVEKSLHRSAGGTGLGLAITKGLVKANYGEIWVESEIGKGSIFTFTLPVSKGERRDLGFRRILEREFQRARENYSTLTLFLIEVLDERAEVKEHLLGQVEEKLKQCLYRKSDITLSRKKEKILAALCDADSKGAHVIRQRIEKELKIYLKGQDVSLHIRVGMATYPVEALSEKELFRKAKERLKEVT